MRKLLIFIFSILVQLSYAQINEKQQQEIQDLWDKSDKYIYKDDLKSLQYAKEASTLSERYGDSFNKAKSYLILGRCLLSVNMYRESLLYLDKGLKEPATKDHPVLGVIFKEFKGDNYGRMGLAEQEFSEYADILNFIPEENNNHEYQRLISRTYARMADNLIKRLKYNEAGRYIDKGIKIQEKLSESEIYNMYLIKGEVCLYKKQHDSAFYYFDKSYKLVNKGQEYEYMSLKSFGDYYKETQNFSKALQFYEQALTNFEKFNVKNAIDKAEIYKNIAQLSEETGNIQRKNEYLRLYHFESEKLQNKNNEAIQAAIKSILNKEHEEKNLIKKKNLNIVISLTVFFGLCLIIFYFQYAKVQRRKRELKVKFEKIVEELELRKKIEADKELEKNQRQFLSQGKNLEDFNYTKQKLISAEKEAELISKLETFESGVAFTEKSFTQSNLAAILETNTKYLTYILKEHRNKNFNDYVNGLKINFILNKLYNHPEYLNYKINYLSEISGFSSQSRFTHIFKQELDMSPSEFITQLSENKVKV